MKFYILLMKFKSCKILDNHNLDYMQVPRCKKDILFHCFAPFKSKKHISDSMQVLLLSAINFLVYYFSNLSSNVLQIPILSTNICQQCVMPFNILLRLKLLLLQQTTIKPVNHTFQSQLVTSFRQNSMSFPFHHVPEIDLVRKIVP